MQEVYGRADHRGLKEVEARPNAPWSLDLVHDQFARGKRFRVLNIVDDVTRECLVAFPDTSISGRLVAARTDRHHRPAWQVGHYRQRQRQRDHCQRDHGSVQRSRDRVAIHRALPVDAEWLCGIA